MGRPWNPVFFAAVALLLTACEDAPDPGPPSDFTVLAQSDDAYARARPGRRLEFPADHGAHHSIR